MKIKAPVLIVCLLFFGGFCPGTETTFWKTGSKQAFLRGRCEGTSITAEGRIVLAPELNVLYQSGDTHVWSIIPGPGDVVFAGTGNEGRVLKISAGVESEALMETREFEIFTMAVDGKGNIYFASSPDGKIYRSDAGGRKSVFATLESTYVWSMIHDGKHLYAGTGGEEGVIYRIDDQGDIETFFVCEDQNVTALLMKDNGQLMAGTALSGLVYEISSRDEGMVVYDSMLDEVTAIVQGKNGTCYFAVVGYSQRGTVFSPAQIKPKQPNPVKPIGGNASHLQTPLSLQAPGETTVSEAQIVRPRETRVPLRGEIMRFTPDRLVREIYARDDQGILSLAVLPGGQILAGTTGKGRILRIDDSGKDALYLSAGGGEVTALQADPAGDRVFGATSNPGRVFSLNNRRRGKGVYFSEVHDAGNTARWGAMTWRIEDGASPGPGLYARAGNTVTPGKEWPSWIGPLTAGDQMDLPPARYIQWKAVFPASEVGQGAAIESICLSYRQINQKPDIKKIDFLAPGEFFQGGGDQEEDGFHSRIDDWLQKRIKAENSGPPSQKPHERKEFRQGMRTVVWEATDPNGDPLTFTLKLRRKGEREGFKLAETLGKNYFSFDTRKIPDGEYAVVLEAFDRRSNPAAEALSIESTSGFFLVDNSPPEIEITRKERDRIEVTIRDRQAIIKMAEYALNAGPWQRFEAADGLLDNRTERFFIHLNGEEREGVIVVTAMDESGNVRSRTWTLD